jgi:hypothetical protein
MDHGDVDDERESRVSQYFHDYRDRRTGSFRFFLSSPWRTLSVVRDLFRLPLLTATTSRETVEAAVVDRALAQRHTLRRFALHAAVLPLPDEPAAYSFGRRKQTLRRMVRKAQKAGVTWRAIEDPVEQKKLITLADDWERVNPHPLYGDVHASNEDCLDYRLWLAAFSRDGRPLVLSVTPVAGEWALLRYFRTIGAGEEQTHARYLLTQVLAEHLIRDGVRYLFDETPPVRLSNGLRHYQRMVGYRLYRIRIRNGAGRTA